MTQPTFFEPIPSRAESPRFRAPKKSRTELVIDYFKAHPHQWIDGLVFAEFAGQYAWRSRISDARATGLNIENRQRVSMQGGPVKSEYRYVPEDVR
jgi:hypothetical protein